MAYWRISEPEWRQPGRGGGYHFLGVVDAVDTQSPDSGVSMSSNIAIGSSAPLGATVQPSGVNFSVYSKSASLVELLLFDSEDDIKPARVIALDAQKNRT